MLKLRVNQVLMTENGDPVGVCELLEGTTEELAQAFVMEGGQRAKRAVFRAGGLKFIADRMLPNTTPEFVSLVFCSVARAVTPGLVLHDATQPLTLEEALAQAHRFVYLCELLEEFDAQGLARVAEQQPVFGEWRNEVMLLSQSLYDLRDLKRFHFSKEKPGQGRLDDGTSRWRAFKRFVEEANQRAGVVQAQQ